jgi:hypothetical protein
MLSGERETDTPETELLADIRAGFEAKKKRSCCRATNWWLPSSKRVVCVDLQMVNAGNQPSVGRREAAGGPERRPAVCGDPRPRRALGFASANSSERKLLPAGN